MQSPKLQHNRLKLIVCGRRWLIRLQLVVFHLPNQVFSMHSNHLYIFYLFSHNSYNHKSYLDNQKYKYIQHRHPHLFINIMGCKHPLMSRNNSHILRQFSLILGILHLHRKHSLHISIKCKTIKLRCLVQLNQMFTHQLLPTWFSLVLCTLPSIKQN